MPQIHVNVTPEFAKDLKRYMRRRGFKTKSEAIRAAVRDGLARLESPCGGTDYRAWLGLANAAPVNPRPRFRGHQDLWDAP